MADTQPLRLDPAEAISFADALGDSPETVIPTHQLRHGLATAYLIGDPPGTSGFRATVIQNTADPTEPTAFGQDAAAIWSILGSLSHWTCVNVDRGVVPDLEALIGSAVGKDIRLLEDLYHVAESLVPAIDHPSVRVLTPADVTLLRDARSVVLSEDWVFGSPERLLAEGIAAAAVIDGRIVAIAHTGARSANYADIGVHTLEPWRRQGLSTAAASAVARAVQAAGQTPVWSCGETNTASRAIARRLGFAEVSRRCYLIPELRRDTG